MLVGEVNRRVETLGISQKVACAQLEIDPSSFYAWRRENETSNSAPVQKANPKRYTQEEKIELCKKVRDLLSEGALPKAAYERAGISDKSYKRWMSEVNVIDALRSTLSLRPVEITRDDEQSTANTSPLTLDAIVEIQTPDGYLIRSQDPKKAAMSAKELRC